MFASFCACPLTVFLLIKAGSQIQAGSPGYNGKYHRANGIGHWTVVRCVIRDALQYILVLDCGIRCSKKRKSHTLTLKLEAGVPDGSNRSRVSNRRPRLTPSFCQKLSKLMEI